MSLTIGTFSSTQFIPSTIAEHIASLPDPYGEAVKHFAMRERDQGGRTITFIFNDESRLTLDITYKVSTK